jgi:hypothetical protein
MALSRANISANSRATPINPAASAQRDDAALSRMLAGVEQWMTTIREIAAEHDASASA